MSKVVARPNGLRRPGRVGAGPGPEAGGARTRRETRQGPRGRATGEVVSWLSITASGYGPLWQTARAEPGSASACRTPGPSPQKLLHSLVSTWLAVLASHSLSRKHVTHGLGGPRLSINAVLRVLVEAEFEGTLHTEGERTGGVG